MQHQLPCCAWPAWLHPNRRSARFAAGSLESSLQYFWQTVLLQPQPWNAQPNHPMNLVFVTTRSGPMEPQHSKIEATCLVGLKVPVPICCYCFSIEPRNCRLLCVTTACCQWDPKEARHLQPELEIHVVACGIWTWTNPSMCSLMAGLSSVPSGPWTTEALGYWEASHTDVWELLGRFKLMYISQNQDAWCAWNGFSGTSKETSKQ